jgi:peptidyl-prolyl cis-trans isomerase C
MLSRYCGSSVRCLAAVGAAALFVFGCGEKKEPAAESTPVAANADMEPIDLAAPVGAAADQAAVVVTVDGKNLSQKQVDSRVRMLAARRGVPPQAMQQALAMMGEQLKQQVVDQFIDTTVLEAEAQRRQIEATDAEVETVLETIKASLPPGETLESAVAAQDVTMDEVRSDVRRSECLRKLFEQETKDVPAVDEAAVTAFYTNNMERFSVPEQVTARHILVGSKASDSPDEQAKAAATAEDLRKQLVDGGDFAALAKAHSSCPSKAKGGDLGSFGRGQMAPPFETAAFSQAIDAIGPVVKTQFGYHVIQVTAREDAKTQSLDEAREKISDYLNDQQRNEHFSELIKRLRAKATITGPGADEAADDEAS